MDRLMNGQIDGWMDKQMDRWMGCIEQTLYNEIITFKLN